MGAPSSPRRCPSLADTVFSANTDLQRVEQLILAGLTRASRLWVRPQTNSPRTSASSMDFLSLCSGALGATVAINNDNSKYAIVSVAGPCS